MQLIYCTEESSFFNIIPEHSDATFAILARVQKVRRDGNRTFFFLHSQPSTNSHIHFLITVESANSQAMSVPHLQRSSRLLGNRDTCQDK